MLFFQIFYDRNNRQDLVFLVDCKPKHEVNIISGRAEVNTGFRYKMCSRFELLIQEQQWYRGVNRVGGCWGYSEYRAVDEDVMEIICVSGDQVVSPRFKCRVPAVC